eukprot:1190707-Prorocentrum_minimum.AAC.4
MNTTQEELDCEVADEEFADADQEVPAMMGQDGSDTMSPDREPITGGQRGYPRIKNQSQEDREDIPGSRTSHRRTERISPDENQSQEDREDIPG